MPADPLLNEVEIFSIPVRVLVIRQVWMRDGQELYLAILTGLQPTDSSERPSSLPLRNFLVNSAHSKRVIGLNSRTKYRLGLRKYSG